jgi:hypothetical protein
MASAAKTGKGVMGQAVSTRRADNTSGIKISPAKLFRGRGIRQLGIRRKRYEGAWP